MARQPNQRWGMSRFPVLRTAQFDTSSKCLQLGFRELKRQSNARTIRV
jgi:hypothetical protein